MRTRLEILRRLTRLHCLRMGLDFFFQRHDSEGSIVIGGVLRNDMTAPPFFRFPKETTHLPQHAKRRGRGPIFYFPRAGSQAG